MKLALKHVCPHSSKACVSCTRCICTRQRLEAQTKKQRKQELQATKRIQACMLCHRGRADSINAAASIEQKLAGRNLFPAPSPSAPFARQRQIDRHVRFPVIRPGPTVMQSSYYCTTTVLLLYYYCTTTVLPRYYCTATVTVLLLYYYCTTTVLLLYYYCTTTVLLLYYYCTTTVLLLYYYCTTTVLLLYYYCTTAVLLYYCTTTVGAEKLQLHLAFKRSTMPIHGKGCAWRRHFGKNMRLYLTFKRSTRQSMGRVARHAENVQLYLAFKRSTTPIHGKGCAWRVKA